MDYSLIFKLANASVLPAWVLLAVAPDWKWTKRLVSSGLWSALLALLYTMVIFQGLGSGSEGDFSSLEGVRDLFSSDAAVLAGWVHYLAFDLLIGSWISTNARLAGYRKVVILPFLLLCFMFGPIGFLLFFVLQLIRNKGLDHGAQSKL